MSTDGRQRSLTYAQTKRKENSEHLDVSLIQYIVKNDVIESLVCYVMGTYAP